jgi:phosphomannomutase
MPFSASNSLQAASQNRSVIEYRRTSANSERPERPSKSNKSVTWRRPALLAKVKARANAKEAHLRAAKSVNRVRTLLDAGNGALAEIAPDIFRRLGFSIDRLECTPDVHSPERSPDCSRTANLAGLRAAVVHSPNSPGIAWDGDGDRVAFVDETGAYLPADEMSLLLIRHLLPQRLAKNRWPMTL